MFAREAARSTSRPLRKPDVQNFYLDDVARTGRTDYEVTSKREHVDPRVRINYGTRGRAAAIVRLFREADAGKQTRKIGSRRRHDARTNSPERVRHVGTEARQTRNELNVSD